MDNKMILKSIIRQKAFSKLFFALILLAISIAMIYSFFPFVVALVTSVPTVTSIEQANELFNKGQTYVSVETEALWDSEYEIITTREKNGRVISEKMTSFFLFAELSDGILIFEVPASFANNEYIESDTIVMKGILTKPKDLQQGAIDNTIDIVASELNVTKQEVASYTSELYVDTVKTEIKAYIYLVLATIIFLVAISLFLIYVLHYFHYRLNKIYRNLNEFGDAEEVEEQIQKEYENAQERIISYSNSHILKTYVVCGKVLLTKDLVWVYKRQVRTNGVITANYVDLKFKNNQHAQILAKNDTHANEMLEIISSSLPVFVGYSKELETLYYKHHDEFLAEWEKMSSAFLPNHEKKS